MTRATTLLDLPEVLKAAQNAAAMLDAVYQWVDQVNAAGGATCITGIAKCNAMLQSLEKNRGRSEALVMEPLRKAIAEACGHAA